MLTIYKYPFKIADAVVILMPAEATILSVQTQGYIPTMWALVDTDKPIEERVFLCAGTGHNLSDLDWTALTHVATFQQEPFVWHLFENRPR